MKLHTIHTGFFKLDGGAMFGIVPKTIWQKLNPPDENNMCTWAMRCLLIEDGNKLILIDNGIGDKQSEKFFSYYHLSGDFSLKKALQNLGYSPSDITDNFLSHLHFDHAGGGVEWNEDRSKYKTTFQNANYWTYKNHWENALDSNPREKASFLKENLLPMEESGQLKFVEDGHDMPFDLFYSDGHTTGMMVAMIPYKNTTVCFVADLFPSMHHIPVNYNMGYDIRPLDIMDEKKRFLEMAAANNWVLFFEHDPVNECCTVELGERGYKVKEVFKLVEL